MKAKGQVWDIGGPPKDIGSLIIRDRKPYKRST
ncbi:hypothetical protein HNQ69_000975 [Bartonella callosciuri]|uniref:Uncharacterized protein n=1 Tax=Bartonella callosciuri TaxID=686223 RepID=A0A840NX73_9HYPH|nr:hypothetical protein [Bartonella callosciuri]